MDGFSLAKELIGKSNSEEDNFLKCLKRSSKKISLKNATQLGKYLYITTDAELVSLAVVKRRVQEGVARGVIESDGLRIYVFTNE
ncbi:uncharacterized protein NEMAJ01_0291 [Nematocida major]|uniref:uncharacterized protein n=1 Tax=Nematocida major TaxID=1912982 RepID=UPI002007FDF9|nr:uncharacterized protein NEMAJ01_0291 [Nematocida major]KAH9385395.1 hypothetical protein NEMAJ01_0291 [Nematocida major]